MKERDFIEWIRSQTELDPLAVPVGPGDDCAVVTLGAEQLLVTTDQVLDGTHVVLDRCGPEAAGRKAMARNLSDIAAMAGVPIGAVASVALPEGFSRADAEAIYRGLRAAGDAFACPVVGGDVAAWSEALAISVTVFGRPAAAAPVLRSGARPGDAICVTGRLGGAWRTGRDLTFRPRISEAVALVSACGLHAMIDLSDGLATDLGHLCRASGVGADVRAGDIPIHPDADLRAALGDGEDYELLFALPPDQADALARQPVESTPISRIGRIIEGDEITLVEPDGARRPITPDGWEHST